MEYILVFIIGMFIMVLRRASDSSNYTMCDKCQNAYEGGQESICDSCKGGSFYNPHGE